MQAYQIIGLMSGTSLDGLDIAACSFKLANGKWSFTLESCDTVDYPIELRNRLATATTYTKQEINLLDVDLGKYIGDRVAEFIAEKSFIPQFVSSHGHTIFHEPEKGITLQIGSPSEISAACKQSVVGDFRSLDVSLGGQGAPLVPIGDKELFGDYDYCLNLGGIANISFTENDSRLAFDICPVNMALNNLALEHHLPYDDEGRMARAGNIIPTLLKKMNGLPFYANTSPKSLGWEWYTSIFSPLLEEYGGLALEDRMATVVEHIAQQVGKTNKLGTGSLLITGGGAFNLFLVERIKHYWSGSVALPPKDIISFKEAIIFAFLGLKRWRDEVNCLASVTGAKHDNCGGIIHHYKTPTNP